MLSMIDAPRTPRVAIFAELLLAAVLTAACGDSTTGARDAGPGDAAAMDAAPSDAGAQDAGADGGAAACVPHGDDGPWLSVTDQGLALGLQDRLRQVRGVAADDFDLDGDTDIYVTNWRDRPMLYVNQGDGTFIEHPAPPTTGFDWGGALGDYDSDGDPDLFVACGGYTDECPNALFRNDGADPMTSLPVFTDVTAEAGVAGPPTESVGGAWADYDADGDLDLFVPCLAGLDETSGLLVDAPDQLYRNEGDGTFTEVAEAAGVAAPGNPRQAAWLDYDEDGFPDLYIPRYAQPNSLFHNRGDGTFEDVTDEMLAEPLAAWGVLSEDFNGDGHLDLLVSGHSTITTGPDGMPVVQEEEHGLYLNDGAGWFVDATTGTGLNDPDDPSHAIRTMGLQTSDMDLDGFLEVVFGNGSTAGGERNALGSFAPGPSGLRWIDRSAVIDLPAPDDGLDPPFPPYPYRTHGMAFFDYDGDGDVDLFVGNGGHGADEPNQLLRNDGLDTGHWVRIDLRGTRDNRDAVGAVVRVSDGPAGASSWEVFRHVHQCSGFNSSQERIQRIGTGACGGPYHVTVRWPGGGLQEVGAVPEGRTTTIVQE